MGVDLVKSMANTSGLNMHSDGVTINHLSAQHAGDANQCRRQQRDIQTPEIKTVCVIKAQQPVERCQRQRHDGHQRMAPGDDQIAYARHQYQIGQACQSRQPAAQAAQARQPQAGARPERVGQKDIGQIGAHQSKQEGHRKMNHHRMNRVSGNRHSADNRFFRHDGLPSRLTMKVLKLTCSLASPLPIIILFFLAGCNGPQSVLNPAGPSAHAVARLWWGMFGFSALVLMVIVALWLYAMWRKPKPLTDNEARRLSLRWIAGGGIALPVVSLTVLLGFGIPMGYRMLPLPLAGQTPLRIDVTGHQWWWEIRYPDAGIVLKNELHLPAGVPVDIHVTSADVIHSFWVPRLAGKLDMIPGRTNILRLQADAPGHFRGQCAEFCGTGHARHGAGGANPYTARFSGLAGGEQT